MSGKRGADNVRLRFLFYQMRAKKQWASTVIGNRENGKMETCETNTRTTVPPRMQNVRQRISPQMYPTCCLPVRMASDD
jgi:hypothetical protein